MLPSKNLIFLTMMGKIAYLNLNEFLAVVFSASRKSKEIEGFLNFLPYSLWGRGHKALHISRDSAFG